jgi:sulfate transport system permease protein
MSTATSSSRVVSMASGSPRSRARAVPLALAASALAYVLILLFLPVVLVLIAALRNGIPTYVTAVSASDTLAALRLTVVVALVAVPINVVFGVAAAWAITKARLPGRGVIAALVDVPLAVSPVVAGMALVLLFGMRGWFAPWLLEHGFRVIFTPLGVVLATMFVTTPYVARELTPVMEAQGQSEEEAALTLGATGWRMFRSVTLPNVRLGILYGAVLCTARAIGEFGAVSVVSGHISAETNTLPLHIELLYNDFDTTGAFAVATLLLVLTLVTIVARHAVESRIARREVAVPSSPLAQGAER